LTQPFNGKAAKAMFYLKNQVPKSYVLFKFSFGSMLKINGP